MDSVLSKYLIISFLTLILVPIYHHFAKLWNLVDIPNERSSHRETTLRGVGIILPIIFVIAYILFETLNIWLTLGLFVGSIVGFLDDKFNLKAWLRASLYGISVISIFMAVPNVTALEIWQLVLMFIISLGAVNAYNFMDGINGISMLYTQVFIATSLIFIHFFYVGLDATSLLVCLIVCMVISFLNVRKKAIAFLGDVGSVFLGLFVIYWVILFSIFENSPVFILMVLVYGTDVVVTIVERLLKKQNIFSAHRSHLYQLLSNELKWNHVTVAVVYSLSQLLVNFIIYQSLQLGWNAQSMVIITIVLVGAFYIFIKYAIVIKLIKKLDVAV